MNALIISCSPLRFHYTTHIKFVRVASYALITRAFLIRPLIKLLSIFVVVGRPLFQDSIPVVFIVRVPREFLARPSIIARLDPFSPSLLFLHLFLLYIPHCFFFFLFSVRAQFVSRAREMVNAQYN